MKSRSSVAGAQTVKLRYGPYKIPNMTKKNILGEEGMLSNFPDVNFPR
jgi:hypothetical protein